MIRRKLERKLGIELSPDSPVPGVELDGFAKRRRPVCVEIWAHQGPAKGGQLGKVMKDMCKLLLCERLLGKGCRKIFAVADEAAVAFLQNSWMGRFALEFGVDIVPVHIPPALSKRIRQAQKRQYR